MIDRSNDKTTERQIKNEILKNGNTLLSSIRKACDSGLFEYREPLKMPLPDYYNGLKAANLFLPAETPLNTL